MGLRKILTDKDPALHKVCRPVEKFDGRLHRLLDDMAETLEQANGVGLAARYSAPGGAGGYRRRDFGAD